jgi:ankyrin repeat protein
MRAEDEHYGTALFEASQHGHAVITARLLQRGTKDNHVTGYQRTAVHEASEEGHTATAALLLENEDSIGVCYLLMKFGVLLFRLASTKRHEAVSFFYNRLKDPSISNSME